MMSALSDNFFTPGDGPITGLFDDHWQTMYRKEFDLLTLPNVEGIAIGSNFRAVSIIVDMLNRLSAGLQSNSLSWREVSARSSRAATNPVSTSLLPCT